MKSKVGDSALKHQMTVAIAMFASRRARLLVPLFLVGSLLYGYSQFLQPAPVQSVALAAVPSTYYLHQAAVLVGSTTYNLADTAAPTSATASTASAPSGAPDIGVWRTFTDPAGISIWVSDPVPVGSSWNVGGNWSFSVFARTQLSGGDTYYFRAQLYRVASDGTTALLATTGQGGSYSVGRNYNTSPYTWTYTLASTTINAGERIGVSFESNSIGGTGKTVYLGFDSTGQNTSFVVPDTMPAPPPPTSTPTPTNTATSTATDTAIPMATSTDTATPTYTGTATPTATGTNTPTPTSTATSAGTPTFTATPTTTPTPPPPGQIPSATATNLLTATGVNQGQLNVPFEAITISQGAGSTTISGMRIQLEGTATDSDMSEVRVLFDSDSSGTLDPAVDAVLGRGSFASRAAEVPFGSLSVVVPPTTTLFIVGDIASTAGSHTVGISLADASAFTSTTPISGTYPMTSNVVAIYPAGYDFQPPSPPQNLRAIARGQTMLKLLWDASVDNTGVMSYTVWSSNDGVTFTQKVWVDAAATSWIDTPLEAGRQYWYYVKANDRNGNTSAPSNTLATTTSSTALFPHKDVYTTNNSCGVCHDLFSTQGGSAAKSRVDTLCYVCHDGTGSVYGVKGEFQPVSDYDATLPGSSRPSYHQVLSPPVDPASKRNDVTCTLCHNQHGYLSLGSYTSGRNLMGPRLLTGSHVSDTQTRTMDEGFCYNCHRPGGSDGDRAYGKGGLISETFGASAHSTTTEGMVADPLASGNQIKCLNCHTPHASDNQYLTARFTGTTIIPPASSYGTVKYREEKLCLDCHKAGAAVGPKGWDVSAQFSAASKHPVDAASNRVECSNCHNVHAVENVAGYDVSDPENTKQLFTYTTAGEKTAFCLKCHNGVGPGSATISSGVVRPYGVNLSYATSNKSAYYTSTGHGSSTVNTACDSCHSPHGSSNVKLLTTGLGGSPVTGNDNSLCQGCHSGAKGPYPATETQRDSVGYFTTGRFPGFTVYQNATYSLHSVNADAGLGYGKGDCKNCHDPHGTANTYDMLRQTYTRNDDSLCFQCHGSTAPGRSRPNIQVYFTGTNTGHRVLTSTSPYLVSGTDLPCYDCHNPHGSANSNQKLLNDQRWSNANTGTASGVRALCLGCHRAIGSDAKTVEGVSMKTLPSTPGEPHYQTGTTSCYDCHGNNDYSSPTSNNVHNPAPSGGDCTSCHASPQGPRRPVVGASGDFVRTAHHVTDGTTTQRITKYDCGVCHMEGDSTTGNTTSYHRNGQVELRDPDTGGLVAGGGFADFTRDTASNVLESWVVNVQDNLCLKCHDSNGAASTAARAPGGTALRPFSSNTRDVPNIFDRFAPTNNFKHPVRAAGTNAYTTASSQNGNVTTMNSPWNQGGTHDKISCFDCHDANGHGGDNTYLTRIETYADNPADPNFMSAQNNFCLTCHNPTTYYTKGSAPGSINEDHGVDQMRTNAYGCRGCHAGLNDLSGLQAPGNGFGKGLIHGGNYTWPAYSKTPGTTARSFIVGGWISGSNPGADGSSTCYGGTCNHNSGGGQSY